MTLDEFRAQNPEYAKVPDQQLADGIYNKFYAGKVTREDFDKSIGLGPMAISDVASQAIQNVPSSAVEAAKATIQPILHPIDTAEAVGNIGGGVLQKIGVMPGDDKEKYADAIGQFYKDRYGSVEGFKRAIAKDPVGVLLDFSTVLSVGGSAAARAPGVIGKAGEVAKTVGDAVNPIGQTIKATGKVAAAVASKTSGTSYDAVVRAAEAGGKRIGSAESNAFWENAAKTAPVSDVVDMAQGALKNLQRDASAEYRSGMQALSKDKTVLSFDDLDKSINEMQKVAKFGSQELEGTRDVRSQLIDTIDKWKKLNPEQYHTPEGFDFLKQKIGEIKNAQEYGTQSWKIASELYNSVRGTIRNQAPVYDKIMSGYAEAKDALDTITRELSLHPNANPGTALRKLQSAMRDGVQTSYGFRKELLAKLENNGAKTLPYALAGQELSPMFPRGLVGDLLTRGAAAAGLTGGAATAGHFIPTAAAFGPAAVLAPTMFSPKLVGAGAYSAGLIGSMLGRPGFQLGRAAEQQ